MSNKSITPLWSYYANEIIEESDEAGCSFLSVKKSAVVVKCNLCGKEIKCIMRPGLRRHLDNNILLIIWYSKRNKKPLRKKR